MERKSEYEKYREILIATLDYLIAHNCGQFVIDGFDGAKSHYEHRRKLVMKYSRQSQLDKLQQQLNEYTKIICANVDLNYPSFIKQATGYEFDLFAELKDRVEAIVKRGYIENFEERTLVTNRIAMLQKMEDGLSEKNKLFSLHEDFLNKIQGTSWSVSNEKEDEMVETIEILAAEKDGEIIETEVIISGDKPQHFEKRDIVAPDGLRRIYITEWSYDQQSHTEVSVIFKSAGGCIYNVEGVRPKLNAYWKNNNTVVIETSSNYKVMMQCYTAQSFDDVIKIEYAELGSTR